SPNITTETVASACKGATAQAGSVGKVYHLRRHFPVCPDVRESYVVMGRVNPSRPRRSGRLEMLKTTTADAVASLREAIAGLPSEAEVRSEFFVQWRSRTIDLLERLFPQDPEPTRQFNELEFSPRRIGKKDSQEQLKLDAYLAG